MGTSFSRPGAWKKLVLNVRRPWRMSCRWRRRPRRPAAAASALATFMRARPPNVAGIRCVYSSGIGPVAVAQHDQLAIVRALQDHGRAATAGMADDAVVALLVGIQGHREEHDAAVALPGHARHERVISIEHGRARPRHSLHEHGLDVGQLRERVHARAGRGDRL